MDLKGITWVGDAYQKFEDMCLEVEEIMYEDTVRFVENQVQTVGVSMKKLYADVMQDLLPSGSEDPAKGTGCGRAEEVYPDMGIFLMPKPTVRNNHHKVHDKGQLSEPLKSVGAKSPDLPPAFLRHVDNVFPLFQGDTAGGVQGKSTKGSLSRMLDLGVIKSSKRESTCQDDLSGLASPATNSSPRKCSSISRKAPFDQQPTLASSGSLHIYGHDPVQESKTDVVDPKAVVLAPSTVDMVSDRANALELGYCECLDAGFPPFDNPLAESNGIYVSEDGSSTNASALSRRFAYTEDYASNSGRPSDWDIDMIVEDRCIDREMESTQRVDAALLEETCKVVSEDEFDFVSQPKGKGFPYKKRIRAVLRALRKQQHDKLAELKSVGISSSGATSVEATKSQALEAEWEVI
ncbi:unnamed protein product [Linum trigynum]|uniref:Uncharacterized protein n=1 Tax=Linum trigynum TaxID=586398 RepID=A0AAV2EUN5_9ROSI